MDITNQIITGTFWLYSVLLPYGWLAIAAMIFIVAPLSLFKSLKPLLNYLRRLFLFYWTYTFLDLALPATLGWLAVFIMGFFAVGVIPLAIVGLLIEGQQYDMVLSLLGMLVLIYVSRVFGFFLIASGEES